LTASDAAKNFAGQIRALSGGSGLRDGDAGPDKDAEIEFPSYGRTPSPERECCINMLTDLVRGQSRNGT
jgi:hypothetical protein